MKFQIVFHNMSSDFFPKCNDQISGDWNQAQSQWKCCIHKIEFMKPTFDAIEWENNESGDNVQIFMYGNWKILASRTKTWQYFSIFVIDEMYINVDFSQSTASRGVSLVKWRNDKYHQTKNRGLPKAPRYTPIYCFLFNWPNVWTQAPNASAAMNTSKCDF